MCHARGVGLEVAEPVRDLIKARDGHPAQALYRTFA